MSIVANKASALSSSGTPLVRERDGQETLSPYSSPPETHASPPCTVPLCTRYDKGGKWGREMEEERREGGMMDKSEIEG